MSIIDRIPRGSRPRFPLCIFESDPLALGVYNFSIAANQNVLLLDNLSPSSVYVISSLSVFGNVAEGDYLEGQEGSAALIPRFNLHLEGSTSFSLYPEPYRMGNYADDLEQLIYFRTQKNDTLRASCFGQVAQSAGMAGFLTIQLQVSFVIYEIQDQAWVKAYAQEREGFMGEPTIHRNGV